ncbi:MAG: hypothetical protein RI580_05020, partial [Halothece sp. Uz-M2-17]|nr:hypothetical protein [Halothece sp. Uz-M2-17]
GSEVDSCIISPFGSNRPKAATFVKGTGVGSLTIDLSFCGLFSLVTRYTLVSTTVMIQITGSAIVHLVHFRSSLIRNLDQKLLNIPTNLYFRHSMILPTATTAGHAEESVDQLPVIK